MTKARRRQEHLAALRAGRTARKTAKREHAQVERDARIAELGREWSTTFIVAPGEEPREVDGRTLFPTTISGALEELSKPLLERFLGSSMLTLRDAKPYAALLEMVATSWNAAVEHDVIDDAAQSAAERYLERAPEMGRAEALDLARMLVFRKRALYPHDERLVVGVMVERDRVANMLHIRAASTGFVRPSEGGAHAGAPRMTRGATSTSPT